MISFIIAVHNCGELFETMFRTLKSTVDLSQHEVIVIDDASASETSELLDRLSSEFKLLRNQENLGFAKSNNIAASHATGEIIALLNSDLELTSGWFEPMLSAFEQTSKVGAVGNIQLNHKTRLIDHAGIFFDLDGMPTHALKTRKRLPKTDYSQTNAVTAACVLIKRELFQEVGGFDEGYLNGMEDVDLCVRLNRLGYRHLVANRSVILHHVSSSPGRHDNNDANTERYRETQADFMKPYGRQEWPAQYLKRYARYWWRMDPARFLHAIFLLITGRNRA